MSDNHCVLIPTEKPRSSPTCFSVSSSVSHSPVSPWFLLGSIQAQCPRTLLWTAGVVWLLTLYLSESWRILKIAYHFCYFYLFYLLIYFFYFYLILLFYYAPSLCLSFRIPTAKRVCAHTGSHQLKPYRTFCLGLGGGDEFQDLVFRSWFSLWEN